MGPDFFMASVSTSQTRGNQLARQGYSASRGIQLATPGVFSWPVQEYSAGQTMGIQLARPWVYVQLASPGVFSWPDQGYMYSWPVQEYSAGQTMGIQLARPGYSAGQS